MISKLKSMTKNTLNLRPKSQSITILLVVRPLKRPEKLSVRS